MSSASWTAWIRSSPDAGPPTDLLSALGPSGRPVTTRPPSPPRRVLQGVEQGAAADGIQTLPLSAAQLLAATVLTVPTLPAGGRTPITIGPREPVAVLVPGVVTTGVTFHLTYRNIAAEGATHTATVGYRLPVVSVALGAVLLHEDFSLRTVLGMTVVLAGVGLTRGPVRGRAPRQARTLADTSAGRPSPKTS
ncbi:EamA family transporter [Streptomyces sp. NPDC012769]|uniref:EamA family transporter n=1 Tax=Streptomyces sp. NPDC012769 TaxID=3364848 RepID=UPI0036C59797